MSVSKIDKSKHLSIFWLLIALMFGIACVIVIRIDGIVGLVLVFLSIIALVIALLFHLEYRSLKKEKKPNLSFTTPDPPVILINQSVSRRRLYQKNKNIKKKIIPLKSIVFTEGSKSYLCMICKLLIRENQKVLICPFCQSYFHEEHLLEWLEIADDCPVCNISLLKQV